jgi:hypothetical protein
MRRGFRQALGKGSAFELGDIDEGNLRALLREPFDQRRADARSAACYEDGTIFQIGKLC